MRGEEISRKEVIYTFHFAGGRSSEKESTSGEHQALAPIPRIARLMALAIRFEGLVREQGMRDYAELARNYTACDAISLPSSGRHFRIGCFFTQRKPTACPIAPTSVHFRQSGTVSPQPE